MKKNISIGSDHAGYELKTKIKEYLINSGYTVIDKGAQSCECVDYPDYAHLVTLDVVENKADCGILVCGSGIGMSIAANKRKGIRAALCTSLYHAKSTRLHNDANVLALGSRFTHEEDALAIVETFLATQYEGGRHQNRIDKIE